MRMHFEHHAHTIVQELVQLLRELPKEGNPNKTRAAKQIIKVYEAPIITRPSSPSSKEDLDEELIPTPICIQSAWHRLAQKATITQANKENVPPPKSTNPFIINPIKEEPTKLNINMEVFEHNVPNINNEDINQEVIRLKAFLFTTPTAPNPIEFKLPSKYQFWIKQDKELGIGYWKVILSAFMNKNKRSDKY
jgi:hypothetical protein